MAATKRQPRKLQAKLQLVEIIWVDSTAVSACSRLDAIKDAHLVPLKAAGYLARYDKECAIITLAYNPDNHDICDKMAIPTGCIKSIREVK